MTDQHPTPTKPSDEDLRAVADAAYDASLAQSEWQAPYSTMRRAVYDHGFDHGFALGVLNHATQTAGSPKQQADESIAVEVLFQLDWQDVRWSEQNLPNGTGPTTRPLGDFAHRDAAFGSKAVHLMTATTLATAATQNTDIAANQGTVSYADILLEEVFEALAEDNPAKLRTELIQIAAVAQQWVGAIDRRASTAPTTDGTAE